MPRYDIVLGPCGGPAHLEDLRSYRSSDIALPHEYTSWPLHDSTGAWHWCRALDPRGELVAAFAVHVFPGRAMPGSRIGMIDRVGRRLHAPAVDSIGGLLSAIAQSIPRLERLDVRVFDESPSMLSRFDASIAAAGGISLPHCRNYTRTLILDLTGTETNVEARLAYSARRNIRRVHSCTGLEIRPVTDQAYTGRLAALLSRAFGRTGGTSPSVRFADVMRDAAESSQSALLGAFLSGRKPPDDLVGFMWGRLQGDHVVYESGASERATELGTIAVGYGVMWELIRWARDAGAGWLDLGGVTPSTAHPHPLDGISTFKRHFSTDERTVAAEFRFEPRPILSTLANASRWLAGRLGARP